MSSQGATFFQKRGIADGDPMSIAVGFLMVLVMYSWLTTASLTPLSVLPGNAPLVSLTNSFLPLGILVVPLMMTMYFSQLLGEEGGARNAANNAIAYARFTGRAESIVARRVGGFVQRTEAKRAAKRKRTTKSGIVAQ